MYYAKIDSSGNLGVWTSTTPLPIQISQYPTSEVYNGYVYFIGGEDTSSANYYYSVYYAKINSDGSIGSWQNASPLLQGTNAATSLEHNGYLYEIGGYNGSNVISNVYYSQINNSSIYLNSSGSGGSIKVQNSYGVNVANIDNSGNINSNGNISLGGTVSAFGSGVNGFDGSILLSNSNSGQLNSNANLDITSGNSVTSSNVGTVGIWNGATSLPSNIDYATSVEYNGYIYEIGGCGSSCPESTVYYASINNDGSIGSWSSTTAFPSNVYYATSIAYNGYVYVIGGEQFSDSYLTTVHYAQINSNGTLGSWNTTSALPTGSAYATSVEYNGYVYYMGGANGFGGLNNTYYAQINSNGTLSSWSSTTTLPQSIEYSTSVVNNGYLYEISGYYYNYGTAEPYVYYTHINSNGTLGSWSSTTSLPQGVEYATSIKYNGYVYVIGGYSGAILSTVYYAPINSNGTFGSWGTTTSLLQGTYFATSVEHNGYIYEIGGVSSSIVDYAQINNSSIVFNGSGSGGNVDIQNSNGINIASIDHNGNLSLQGSNFVGGNLSIYGTGNNYINGNTILTTSDLSVSGVATPAAPTGTSSNTGGYLNYVSGGYNYEIIGVDSNGGSLPSSSVNVSLNTVSTPSGVSASVGTSGSVGSYLSPSTTYYYEVTATTPNGETTVSSQVSGTEGATAYPITISWSAVSGATGYNVYKSTTSGSEVFLSSINSGSTLSYVDSGSTSSGTSSPPLSNDSYTNTNTISLQWNSVSGATSYTIYRSAGSGFVNAYELNNITSTSYTDNGLGWEYVGQSLYTGNTSSLSGGNLITSNNISSGGNLNSYGNGTNSLNGTVFLSNASSDILSSDVSLNLNSGEGNVGALSSWGLTSSVPEFINSAAFTEYNGYAYTIGGWGPSNNQLYSVYYSQINSNGTLGTWTATTSLPSSMDSYESSASAYNGYIYILAGFPSGGAVYYAPINANGTIGTWSATSSFSSNISNAVSFAYNGYMYEIADAVYGGVASYYASINSNGTLGTWISTTALPTALYGSGTEYEGYVYMTNGTSTYYSKINSNGTLGVWNITSSINGGSLGENSITTAYNGYIYSYEDSDYSSGSAYYAKINSNGTLGNWTGTNLPTTCANTGIAVDSGIGSSGTVYQFCPGYTASNVYYSQILTIGSVNNWNSTTSLPLGANGYAGSTVIYNGYIYYLGGCCSSSAVYYATVSSTGIIGSWNSTSSLPSGIYQGSAVEYSGYIYVMGGNHVSTVYYSQVQSNGTLGSWNATTSLPQNIYFGSSVAYNGYVYEIGGGDTNAYSVYYAKVNSSGTIGTWNSTTPTPYGTGQSPVLEYNGYLYIFISGISAYYAQIQSNGSVGNWIATSSLASGASSDTAGATVYNGYIYLIGGYPYLTSVTYAQIQSNGSLGSWSVGINLPIGTSGLRSTSYNGYIYAVGGQNYGSPGASNVYYAQVNSGTTYVGGAGVGGSVNVKNSNGDNVASIDNIH